MTEMNLVNGGAPMMEASKASASPSPHLGARLSGISDRAIAWLFISPTIVLLLAINIFPLIWTIYMSFTNFKANMGWMKYK